MMMKANLAILTYSILSLLALGELYFQLSTSPLLLYLTWNQRYAIILGSVLLIFCLGMLAYSIRIYQKEQNQQTTRNETSAENTQ